jgi:hypothetical protein
MTQEESTAFSKEMKMTPSPVAAEKILRGIEKKSDHVFIGSDSNTLDKLSRLNAGAGPPRSATRSARPCCPR